jgi:hypothetical protein
MAATPWRVRTVTERTAPDHGLLRQVLAYLRAGEWIKAHNLVQQDGSALAAWLHGIVHIEEGDLEDAEYWYGQAGRHFRSRGTLAQELADFEAGLPPLT